MTSWQTSAALHQAEIDMLKANSADRDLIGEIERRMQGRSRLIKMLRRRFRRQGLVNVSGDSLHPYWLPRDSIG
jgi:hypothetical protein